MGDNFTAISYRKHFKYLMDQKSSRMYCADNFEVTSYCNSRFNSNNTNILARIQNSLASALNKNKWLPKYIALVLDDDLIKYLDCHRKGISTMYGTWLEWLVKEVNALVKAKWSILPRKARSDVYIYWLLAPTRSFWGR